MKLCIDNFNIILNLCTFTTNTHGIVILRHILKLSQHLPYNRFEIVSLANNNINV